MRTKRITLTLLFLLTAALTVGAPAALSAATPSLLPKLEPITAANASRLQPIAMLGVDVLHDAAWSPDGETLALVGTSGLWRYRVGQPAPERIEGYIGLFRSVAYSPKGDRFATGSDVGRIRLWDAATWKPTDVLQGAGESVEKLAYSPDGSLLAAGFADGSVRLWDMAKRSVVHEWKVEGRVRDLAFSPDGQEIAVAARRCSLLNVSGDEVIELPELDYAQSVAFSPDGHWLMVSDQEGYGEGGWITISYLWDRNLKRWKLHVSLGELAGFDKQGWLVTYDYRRSVAWNMVDLVHVPLETDHMGDSILKDEDAVRHRVFPGGQFAAFSPDNSRIAVFTNTVVSIADFRTGVTVNTFQLPGFPSLEDGDVYALAFSPTEPVLAFSEDNKVRLWNTETGYYQNFLKGHDADVGALAFSHDGEWLATGSGYLKAVYGGPSTEDEAVRIWDVHRGAPQVMLHGYEYPIDELQISTNGVFVYSRSEFWDSPDEKPLWQVTPFTNPVRLFQKATVGYVVFSPTNPDLAAITFIDSTSGELMLWHPYSGNHAHLEYGEDAWSRPIFSADGRLLLSSSGNTWMLLDVEDQKLLKAGSEGAAVGISPRGKTIALVGEDNNIIFLDTKNFGVIAQTPPIDIRMPSYNVFNDQAKRSVFTADGTLFLTGTQLIDVKRGQVVRHITIPGVYYPNQEHDYQLGLSADNQLIAITEGGGVRLWGVIAK